MSGLPRVRAHAALLACAALVLAASVRAEIDERDLARVVNETLLRRPAARVGLYSRVRLETGTSAIRVELPFDDLRVDARQRAAAAGWRSNDLVVIVIVSEQVLMMCEADGSDGC